ncbi:uncharacterized protein FOMMEDRAFT_165223 [Fomitiporia mediterranea MF3/22]|uniref:uncharacterized protein n=1 Tax=Fomitiporia mediterranea (strain MF3/22) TaxID=694068 RepID=UPI0004408791|nr:uncharacterized protein FOMMEDRAFT_165223 [Fomitiporia mediterranea MF3/22]EJD06418.1 hypothetical protein FOMMEDRAFT_165223 [Fomitiporia mediterranea MF3/22]
MTTEPNEGEKVNSSFKMSTSIPKFSNPHSLIQSSEPCSRKRVFRDEDEDGVSDSEIERARSKAGYQEDALKWLEGYLQASLVTHEGEHGSKREGDGPVEDELRQKKRKRKSAKVDATAKGEDASTSLFDYRLFSTDSSPRKINVLPKPPVVIKPADREYEDTPSRAEERTKQAREVTVDFSWVIQQSRMSYPKRQNESKKHIILRPASETTSLMNDLADLLIIECPHPRPTSLPLSRSQLSTYCPLTSRNKKLLPSPHELKARLCCPLLPVSPANGEEKERKRKRMRARKRPKMSLM